MTWTRAQLLKMPARLSLRTGCIQSSTWAAIQMMRSSQSMSGTMNMCKWRRMKVGYRAMQAALACALAFAPAEQPVDFWAPSGSALGCAGCGVVAFEARRLGTMLGRWLSFSVRSSTAVCAGTLHRLAGCAGPVSSAGLLVCMAYEPQTSRARGGGMSAEGLCW